MTSDTLPENAILAKELLASFERQEKQSQIMQGQMTAMQGQLTAIPAQLGDLSTRMVRLEDKVTKMELTVTDQAAFARGAETSRKETKSDFMPFVQALMGAIVGAGVCIMGYLLTRSSATPALIPGK